MNLVPRRVVEDYFRGKSVAVVGSGPGVLKNKPGFIDSHDVVVRVNNHKITAETGQRTDVYYSFFGYSIRKKRHELKREGVNLCICKCPNAKFMDSDWHDQRGKSNGVDFRPIYQRRKGWWFCDTYVPTVDEFLANFDLLGGHVPTTGFSAILDVLSFEPASVYLTGFDFFQSGVHNVDERWRKRNNSDPIGHDPEGELAWLKQNISNYPITLDTMLKKTLA